jgi:hypothetical protein
MATGTGIGTGTIPRRPDRSPGELSPAAGPLTVSAGS